MGRKERHMHNVVGVIGGFLGLGLFIWGAITAVDELFELEHGDIYGGFATALIGLVMFRVFSELLDDE